MATLSIPCNTSAKFENCNARLVRVTGISGEITFTCTRNGSGDPYIRLYDRFARLLASDDDSAGNYGSKITRNLSKGEVYYLIVRNLSGTTNNTYNLTSTQGSLSLVAVTGDLSIRKVPNHKAFTGTLSLEAPFNEISLHKIPKLSLKTGGDFTFSDYEDIYFGSFRIGYFGCSRPLAIRSVQYTTSLSNIVFVSPDGEISLNCNFPFKGNVKITATVTLTDNRILQASRTFKLFLPPLLLGNAKLNCLNVSKFIRGFSYTGRVQAIWLDPGVYVVECWGGCSGYSCRDGNFSSINVSRQGGAYTKGKLTLKERIRLYIYVGGAGEDTLPSNYFHVPGGWNGGGWGDWDNNDDEYGSAGGGATDIRLVEGNWDDFESLKSRIMVAAGAGGTADSATGGFGGDLASVQGGACVQATQTFGFAFGKGYDLGTIINNGTAAGGGGGYYGGDRSRTVQYGATSGGSSFISGHPGCDAVAENSNASKIIHTGQPIHYSGLKFIETEMISGGEWMNTPLGRTMGNLSAGFCRIVRVSF